MSWIDIGDIEDVPLCGARLVKTGVGYVALFRTGDLEVFAAWNICPHKGGPLSEGIDPPWSIRDMPFAQLGFLGL